MTKEVIKEVKRVTRLGFEMYQGEAWEVVPDGMDEHGKLVNRKVKMLARVELWDEDSVPYALDRLLAKLNEEEGERDATD